jgi:hypothetical protein
MASKGATLWNDNEGERRRRINCEKKLVGSELVDFLSLSNFKIYT